MFIPGLGQLGNRRYIKAVVIIGLETWFVASAIHYGRQAGDARDRYESIPMSDPTSRNRWYEFYDNKRINQSKFTWFAGITIFLSMFDAYVDAHLSGSPISSRNDKFSIDLIPDNSGMTASFAYHF